MTDFMEKIKPDTISDVYEMASFEVPSLFKNVPLERTIHITLERT